MTYAIIAVTLVVSILAFNRQGLFDRLKFNAYLISKNKQWYRFLSYGLVHADYTHLLVNMFVFYSFGGIVEAFFEHYFGIRSLLYYFFLYTGGIAFSTLYDFGVHKKDSWYNAVGASGAVSAVVFSSIILYPSGRIFLFFIPIGIPAPLFGLLYLAYSFYMAKKAKDNIGHNAHFGGAVFGIVYTVVLDPKVLYSFLTYLDSF